MKKDFSLFENLNPGFYTSEAEKTFPLEAVRESDGLTLDTDGIKARLKFSGNGEEFCYDVSLTNSSSGVYAPESLLLDLGVDTYLDSYPEWNDKYFPSFIRCEKTHAYGYFMSPLGDVLAFCCDTPVASYSLDYNYIAKDRGYGHRINGAALALINALPLPEHHPQDMFSLKPGESRSWRISFAQLNELSDFPDWLADNGIPYISAEKFTLCPGEEIKLSVKSKADYRLTVLSPSGRELKDGRAEEYGEYSVLLETSDKKRATAVLFCRKPWDWYLKRAREEMLNKPPHATTHCESWYGFYSAYLAKKHYPDSALDSSADAIFNEIMPRMFNFERIKPRLIPERIQNVSALIGILVDRFEADRENNAESLMLASRFADWLITRQKTDGAYYRDNSHYTCVIYPAKTMLELVSAERSMAKENEYYAFAAEQHYASAERAIENLMRLRENIGTEGEHTLEDGMISCAALQIALFALGLPENERKPYIETAEHLIGVHRCLEQLCPPDARVRGSSIRYWEAQYDVILNRNFITSPHGWSAWLIYALYYLYLLTGKEEYLRQMMDGMGACAQLMSLGGELRWGFAVDPFISASEILVPNLSKRVADAYHSVKLENPAYRGKFVSGVIGEQYIDMISGWYRTCKSQFVNGGHFNCPLITENESVRVDRQGGCCDNDVHEIFKCLEETVLKKAFILERADGSLLSYGCRAERTDRGIDAELFEDTEYLHLNLQNPVRVFLNGKEYQSKNRPEMLCLDVL